MNPHFRRVAQICFQNAVIVADRYHVVRQVYWAMERVRKTEQTKLAEILQEVQIPALKVNREINRRRNE